MMNKEYDGMPEFVKTPVPESVHQRILETCASLPDRGPVRANRAVKAVLAAAASVAAAFVLLLGVNAVNPVFAESIPLLGNVFQEINGRMKLAVGSNIGTYGGIEEVRGVSAVSGGMELSLKEVYSDGYYIHCAFSLKIPEEQDKQYDYINGRMSVRLNGEALTNSGSGVYNIYMEPSEEGYNGTCSIKLPKPAENGEKLALSYQVDSLYSVYNVATDYREDKLECSFDGSYEVTADTTNNSSARGFTGSGDVKILSVESTPSYTEIAYEIPFWGLNHGLEIGSLPTLYLADGTIVSSNGLKDPVYSRTPWDAESLSGTMVYDGLPQGTDTLVLRFDNQFIAGNSPEKKGAKIIEEITIDLKNRTYAPTAGYLEEGLKPYTDLFTDYNKLSWSIVFNDLFSKPEYYNALSMDTVFSLDEIFQGDFAPESIEIGSDGSVEMGWFKRGDDYKAVTLSIEKNGKTIAQTDSTEGDMFENQTMAWARGDVDSLYRDLEENIDKELNPELYEEEKTSLDNSIKEKINGRRFYNFQFKLNEQAEVQFMDRVTLKLTDSAGGETVYSKEIILVNKEVREDPGYRG